MVKFRIRVLVMVRSEGKVGNGHSHLILILEKNGKTLLMGVSLTLDGGKHVSITKK